MPGMPGGCARVAGGVGASDEGIESIKCPCPRAHGHQVQSGPEHPLCMSGVTECKSGPEPPNYITISHMYTSQLSWCISEAAVNAPWSINSIYRPAC